MISFGIKYWFIFLLITFAVAALFSFILYYRQKKGNKLTKAQIITLAVLRFMSVLTISFLLLSPFIRNLKKNTENPVVIMAWDNSESMTFPDSAKAVTEITGLEEKLLSELQKDFSVAEYAFGEETTTLKKLDFSEKKSDYSDVISTIINNHFNENIGAVILAGDGIYNKGKNPVNLTNKINFPVYTIGFGDTSVVVDSRIQDIQVNRTAFSGNKFEVQIDALFSKLKGKNLKLSVFRNNKEIAGTVVTPPDNNYFFTKQFIIEAGKPGLKHYTVKIDAVKNERNTKNNITGFVVNVLESKQKILILADGVHPDIGAVKNTLDLQKTYDVSVFTKEPYPADISKYNLLILNQLPTRSKSAAKIIKNAEKNRIPVLFIIGNRTFLPQLNSLAQGVTIKQLAGNGEEAQAVLNPAYATFNLSDDFKELLPKFPPLQVPYADFELDAEFTPLFYQKILNIETAKPLIATGHVKGRKTGFIFGEGLWRWRLYNYYANQSRNQFDELINQLVQYLALRENEDNFVIDYKPVYAETDDIIINAEVYNDAFKRINSEEVNIEIVNDKGEKLNFTFDVQREKYYLNAGNLSTGDYTFSANVTIGDKTFNKTGRFTVTPVSLESVTTRADHNMLYRLSDQTGGKLFQPDKIDNLLKDLKNNNKLKPVTYYQEMVYELLNLRWLFFVILFLLSVEWFLRKFWGIY